MSLQEKRKQLRSLIPTSKELTFGCEVVIKGTRGLIKYEDGRERVDIVLEKTRPTKDMHSYTLLVPSDWHPEQSSCCAFAFKEELKIIGHPPQLNDLLMALGTSKQRNEFFVCDEGYFWECRGCETGKECDCDENNFLLKDVPKFRYDLTADPLSQDEETTQKLIDLLK